MRYDNSKIQELILKYKENRKEETFNELYTECQPLIKKMVGKLTPPYHSALDFDDMLQFGNIALMESVEKYKPDKGAMFTTFLHTNISKYMDWKVFKPYEAVKRIPTGEVLSLNFDGVEEDKLDIYDKMLGVSEDKYERFDNEVLDNMCRRLRPSEKQIAMLLLEGYSKREIAKIINQKEMYVHNRVKIIRNNLVV